MSKDELEGESEYETEEEKYIDANGQMKIRQVKRKKEKPF